MIYKSLAYLLLLLSLLILPFLGEKPIASLAQPQSYLDNGEWAEPINLSHSGSTSSSQLIIDSEGRFYALWVDEYEGYIASFSADGINWSQPVPVNFPFSSQDGSPVFVPDSRGYIHAFWNDNTNALYYSRVADNSFASGAAWGEITQLAESAVDFSVVTDDQQIIHLTYLRILNSDESPSGVYYRSSKDNGANWSRSNSLYLSPYFRSLKPGDANVIITNVGDSSEYVVWDNRPLKLILFSRSEDRGNNWTEPVILRSPNVEDGNNIPFGVNIAANEAGMLIIWHLGQPGANCDQYSQWSTDNGNSWSNPLLISQNKYGCSPDSKFFALQDGLILFRTNMEDQPRLVAWNGSEWSNKQNILTSFVDPETYNSINYLVQQTIYNGSAKLYVIGYDVGGIGDTWLTASSLDFISDWFPDPSRWSEPAVIYSTPSEIYSFSISVDEMNQFHLMWIQNDLTNGIETSSIYYSKYDGNLWTQPQAIYTSNTGVISELDTAVDKERLMLVWSEGSKDQVFYSWSNINTAQNSAEWAPPFQLSISLESGESPKILVDTSGDIYIVYSKPINEGRGIYIHKSASGGRDWSSPIQVFNAETAGWEIADSPELATNQDGSVYVIWAKKSFPENGYLLALYTSQSNDHGFTWSDPSVLEEGDLTWGQISGIGNMNIYRIWQEVDISDLLVNWYQVSADGGATWTLTTSITDPEPNLGSPVVTTDIAGRLYLFQPIQIAPEITGFSNRIWDSDRWLLGDRIIIDSNEQFIPGSLTTAISPSGNLVLTYLEQVTDRTTGSTSYILYYSNQVVDIPPLTPTTTTIPVVTKEPTQTTIAAIESPTVEFPVNTPTPYQEVVNNSSQGYRNLPVIALILGTGVIIGIITIFAIYYIVANRRIK